MRSSITIVAAAVFLTVFSTGRAGAQERGDVGITMGYPAAVGVLFHISDSLAIRPEASFTTASSDITLTSSSSTLYGVGISALLYVKRWDALRAYVVPRYAYQHGTSTSTLDLNLPVTLPINLPDVETKTTIDQHSFGGAFGAQYALHAHFGVFGEVGGAYTISKTSSSLSIPLPDSRSNPTGHSFALRSSAGVIFYF